MKWLSRYIARPSSYPGCSSLLTIAVACAFLVSNVQAQEVSASAAPSKNTLDGQLVLALPAALPTGTTAGVGVGFARIATPGGRLAWGGRASWSTATEYSLVDTVRNDDIRMRLCGVLQHVAGRGSFGLRLGLGATVVYEGRTRAQGNRAGLSGSALETTAWYLLPAADLEGVVVLRVWDSWGMSISGGPTLHIIAGGARAGWSSGLGVTWQH
jgi:hypothetical protein